MKKLFLAALFLLMSISAFAGGKSVLDNGVKFIEIKRDFTETLSVVFFVRGGTVRETEANNGIGSLFGSVWVKSSELIKKIEFYGGGIGSSVGSDFMETSFSIPSEYFDELIPYYESLILKPVIDKKIFEHDKNFQKEGIKAADDNPESKAFRGFMSATYKDHPYGLSPEGTIESVDGLKPEDLEKYAEDMLQGVNITVAVAGKYSDKQLAKIKAVFAKLPKGTPYAASCTGSAVKEDVTITEEDKDLQQAKLYIGYTAPDASGDMYPAVKLISDIVGGGMSSRYFNELRKDKGYAYSVGAAYPSRICSSRFMAHIGLSEENVPDAIESIQRINKEFVNDLTEKELEAVKNYMLGRILIDSQTNSKQAWYACFFENAGLGSEYFANYIEIIRKISLEDVKKAAKIFDGPKTVFILK